MFVLGLCGAAQSGKSTIAKHLVETYGFKRLRMADTLKGMLKVAGLTDAQLDGAEKEVPLPLLCGHTPRWAMQTLGTEWARECLGEDFWVNVVQSQILQEVKRRPNARIVIDDIRFLNEASMVMRLRGRLWRVRRTAVEPEVRLRSALQLLTGKGHASEAYWRTLPFHDEIENNATMEGLLAQVDPLIREELDRVHG